MMNPQYVNQQYPAGYNPGYGAPPSSQAPQNFGGLPMQSPSGQFGGVPPPSSVSSGSRERSGMPISTYGSPSGKIGATGPWMPVDSTGPPVSNAGQPMSNAGPPMSQAGPLMSQAGPPMSHAGPPMSHAGPPMSHAGQAMSNGPTTGMSGTPGPVPPFRGPAPQAGPGMMSRPPGVPSGLQQAPAPNTGQVTNQMGSLTLGSQQASHPGTPVNTPTPGSQPVQHPRSSSGMPPLGATGQSAQGSSGYPTGAPPMSGTVPAMSSGASSAAGTMGYGQGPLSGPPGMSQSGQRPPSSVSGQFGAPPQPGLGSMSSQQSSVGMPPRPGSAGMPPQSGPGGMPPQTGLSGMPPQPHLGGMPPPSPGGMPPQPGAGSMPPQLGAGGMPPQPGAGDMPPQPGAGGMPPQPSAGGMPPQPSPGMGFQGVQSYSGLVSGTMAPPQQQPRKLDPDQMPSPIQVIEDDRHNRSGEFIATQRHYLPPLVTTDFTAKDRGNCNPRMMRSTLSFVPCTADMLKQSSLAFSLAINPFARLGADEDPLPVVDLGLLGPIRCNRCKAYMNPYMQFVDGGRRIQCCFCDCHTDVPPEYFAHLDHTGRRVDTDQRPELCLGAYEFVATTDYCKNNTLPKPPAFIFMIDVSYNAVKSGLVQLLCDNLKDEILVNLPREYDMEESEVRVGFVTYAKDLQFYNVKGSLAQPQMLVVSDIQDVFVPLLDGFLVKLSESEAVIDALLAQIPQMFADSRETEIVLGPVIQAGLDALKASDCSGKLFIFHTSLPIAEAPGKLKNRDDRKLLGTDKEKTLLTPAINFYTKLGQECVAAGCGVDLFLFPNSYVDIATIAEVPRLTGGNIYKYTYFQADLDGHRLLEDLKTNITRPIAFDAIMRVRTSTGIRPVDFLGNFYMANTTDVELATLDCDKTITVEIKHDDKLTEAEGAYVQAAILYTSVSGQRRLRILNMSFNCCTQLADLFKNCELDTFINYVAKLAIRESLNSNPKTVRENLMNRCAQILACYRKNCASPSSAGQLILPECMKLLPLYTNCVVKSHVLQGGTEIATDERSYLIHAVNSMSVKDTQVFFYPRLLPLHELDLDSECGTFPPAIRCSYERLKDNGIYLIENGLSMLLWLGMNVPQEWVYSLFGVQSVAQIDIDRNELQNLDNAISRHVRSVIQKVREERFRYLKLIIVRQRDKLEMVFQQYLVEDRNASGGASYVDFLCHIHKEIRALLS